MFEKIQSELCHHQHFRQRLRADFPDADDETIRDTLEGLTDLPEMIAAVVRSQLEDLALARGLKKRINEMHERLARFERRADNKRELIRSVMERAEIYKITEPDFTASLRRTPPPLIVADEQEIPEDFWKPQPPKLDRQGLIAALKSGREIPGAALGNGAQSLSVRTK